jgi:hypothetical protein
VLRRQEIPEWDCGLRGGKSNKPVFKPHSPKLPLGYEQLQSNKTGLAYSVIQP